VNFPDFLHNFAEIKAFCNLLILFFDQLSIFYGLIWSAAPTATADHVGDAAPEEPYLDLLPNSHFLERLKSLLLDRIVIIFIIGVQDLDSQELLGECNEACNWEANGH